MTDIGDTIAPKSDQQNADDYMLGPRTVTIVSVKVFDPKTTQQPVHLELAEFPGRPYKPNKSMRRVLSKAWGTKSAEYVGRAMTLYRNPAVTYGGKTLGGIEISHLSHIEKPVTIPLTVRTNGKIDFVVHPLKVQVEQAPTTEQATPSRSWYEEAVALNGNADGLHALYMDAEAAGAASNVLEGIKSMVKPDGA